MMRVKAARQHEVNLCGQWYLLASAHQYSFQQIALFHWFPGDTVGICNMSVLEIETILLGFLLY